MATIGGSIFIRNAIQYDYCVIPAIESLLPLCSEIVVLDCQSDDGTTEMLIEFAKKHPKIKLFVGEQWDCAPNYERLSKLANKAISLLSTDWHIMMQGDEVLHEDSIPVIQRAINLPNSFRGFMCRRINLFRDVNSQLRFDLPTERKPCSDQVIRIGKIKTRAMGDAESLSANPCGDIFRDEIVIFHYGFVRRNIIEKVIAMQTWFHGPGSEPDPRIVVMKSDGIFRSEVFFNDDEIIPITRAHPKVAGEWVRERQPLNGDA